MRRRGKSTSILGSANATLGSSFGWFGGGGGTKTYSYNASGDGTGAVLGGATTTYIVDDAHRMSDWTQTGATTMSATYDGRGLLSSTMFPPSKFRKESHFTFSTSGVLMNRSTIQLPGPLEIEDYWYFSFAGMPVALWRTNALSHSSPIETFVVDHLGTPVAWTNAPTSNAGFDPFGVDYAGNLNNLGADHIFPGQTVDIFQQPNASLYYNVNRWYETGTGRYASADPLGVGGSSRRGPNLLYAYAAGNPISFIDRLGLWTTIGCTKAQASVIGGAINRAKQSIDNPRNPCGLCQSDGGNLKKNIDDSTYYCADNNDFALAFHRMSPGDCGSVYNAQGQKDGFSIALAFDTPPGLPPSPPGGPCKCLAGTILHEASHNALGTSDYANDNNAYDLERKCNSNGDYGCTP